MCRDHDQEAEKSRPSAWRPKRIDAGVREMQPGNGILNTPDSCQHTPSEYKGFMIARLCAVNGSAYAMGIEECCVSYGVIHALEKAAKAGINVDRSRGVQMQPAEDWGEWFDPVHVSLQGA